MDKIYAKGLRIFQPNKNAPDFVKGSLIITLQDIQDFFIEQAEHKQVYNGKDQLKCTILEGKSGLYVTLDTWKPSKDEKKQNDPIEDLHF